MAENTSVIDDDFIECSERMLDDIENSGNVEIGLDAGIQLTGSYDALH